jgi:hypothetical protein
MSDTPGPADSAEYQLEGKDGNWNKALVPAPPESMAR